MVKVPGPSETDIHDAADRFAGTIIDHLRAAVHEITDRFAEIVTPDDMAALHTVWTTDVTDNLLPHIRETYIESAHAQASRHRAALTADASQDPDVWEIINPEVEAYLLTANNRLVALGDDVWNQCRDILIASNQDGEGVRAIRDKIHGQVGLAEPRSAVIARTEINRAANAGAITQMRATAIEGMTKTWLAADDSRTREAHAEADGQTVAIADKFTVGGEAIDHPGDGSPANVVNCRCTVTYDIPDGSMTASLPPGVVRSNVTKAKLFAFGRSAQPRDRHGRWTKGVGGGAPIEAPDKVDQAALDKID
jgi:hypothetical protein